MIEFHNVEKSYGDKHVLKGFSLSVNQGEIFGLLAANGGGKTTSMRIAMGLLQPDKGHVKLGGTTVVPGAVRGIGYMPEERGLYSDEKVTSQLKYFARLHKVAAADIDARVNKILDSLEISEHANKTVKQLSLGNRQRVQIAAALVHDPEILILDEPFSGLDPKAVNRTLDILNQLSAAGKTILFSSHQLDLVDRISHRIAVMDEGKTIFEGTSAEFKAKASPRCVVVGVRFNPGRGMDDLDFSRCPFVTNVNYTGSEIELDVSSENLTLREILDSGLMPEEILSIFRREETLLTSMSGLLSPADVPADNPNPGSQT